MSPPQPVTGTPDYETYKITGLSGNVTIESTEEIAVALYNVSGDVGAAGYFSGFPPSVVNAPALSHLGWVALLALMTAAVVVLVVTRFRL